MNTAVNTIFQNFFACILLKGFKQGIADKSIMVNPIMHTIRASYLKPRKNAGNEKPLPGGLNLKKMMNRETVITSKKIKTTENIQRKSFGTFCIASMKNYLTIE